MNSYFDDEFYEPSEAEAKMREITEMLKGSVKQEIMNELERLRSENAELQKYKEKWRENDAELARSLRELKAEKANLERDVKKARIKELFGDHIVSAWVAQLVYAEKPKCDKCNSERMIEYYTPRGKKCYESCECSEREISYRPHKTELVAFESEMCWGDVEWHRSYYTAPIIRNDGSEFVESVERTGKVYRGEPFFKIDDSYCATKCVFLMNQSARNSAITSTTKKKKSKRGNKNGT